MTPTLPTLPPMLSRAGRPAAAAARPRWARVPAVATLGVLLAGCTRAPAITLAGATFPGWFFCLAGGVALTVAVHAVLQRTVGTAFLRPLPVSYTGLFAVFSALLWLTFFYR